MMTGASSRRGALMAPAAVQPSATPRTRRPTIADYFSRRTTIRSIAGDNEKGRVEETRPGETTIGRDALVRGAPVPIVVVVAVAVHAKIGHADVQRTLEPERQHRTRSQAHRSAAHLGAGDAANDVADEVAAAGVD